VAIYQVSLSKLYVKGNIFKGIGQTSGELVGMIIVEIF
jgi:hypothetical protein